MARNTSARDPRAPARVLARGSAWLAACAAAATAPAQVVRWSEVLPADRVEAAKRNRLFDELGEIHVVLSPAIARLQDVATVVPGARRNELFAPGALEPAAAAVLDEVDNAGVPLSGSIVLDQVEQALKLAFHGRVGPSLRDLEEVGRADKTGLPAFVCAVDAKAEVGPDRRSLRLRLSVRLARVTFDTDPRSLRRPVQVVDLLFADQAAGIALLPAPPADTNAKAQYAREVQQAFTRAVREARDGIALSLFGHPRVFDAARSWSSTATPQLGGTLRGGRTP